MLIATADSKKPALAIIQRTPASKCLSCSHWLYRVQLVAGAGGGHGAG